MHTATSSSSEIKLVLNDTTNTDVLVCLEFKIDTHILTRPYASLALAKTDALPIIVLPNAE